MRAGPTLVIKAPGCKQLLRLGTLASVNFLRATLWTDGKDSGPMCPLYDALRKHPTEGVLFWVDDCEEVGRIERPYKPGPIRWFSHVEGFKELQELCPDPPPPPPVPAEWHDLPYALHPSAMDHLAALARGLGDTPGKRQYLRTRFWWAGNDPIRGSTGRRLNGLHVHNLQILIGLLDEEHPHQRCSKAEALRELGRFDEALALLDFDFPEGFGHWPARVRELALAGNATVAEVPVKPGP